jgi:hypothetical protein
MTTLLCEFCGECEVTPIKERGGQAFVGDGYIEANDNQYLVEYSCDKCGTFHGCAVENMPCEHPYPRDVVTDWLKTWRFASGDFHTTNQRYWSHYYQAAISAVRCQLCGATFNTVMIWHWSRDGYAPINTERDPEYYPALKASLKAQYSERLNEYEVVNI